MVEYGKVNVKLSNAQLKKIKTAVKDKIETTNILLKGVSKTIKNETKKQEEGFLSMLLGILGANLLEYLLKCRKDTENIDPKMVRTKNNRLIMQ